VEAILLENTLHEDAEDDHHQADDGCDFDSDAHDVDQDGSDGGEGSTSSGSESGSDDGEEGGESEGWLMPLTQACKLEFKKLVPVRPNHPSVLRC
jgi:hypothetical protein